MHTNIELKVNRLNQLYHRIVESCFVDEELDTEQFKNLIKQVKSLGYRFRVSEGICDDGCYFQTDSVTNWIGFAPRNHQIDGYILF